MMCSLSRTAAARILRIASAMVVVVHTNGQACNQVSIANHSHNLYSSTATGCTTIFHYMYNNQPTLFNTCTITNQPSFTTRTNQPSYLHYNNQSTQPTLLPPLIIIAGGLLLLRNG